jgi:hypothetical protein
MKRSKIPQRLRKKINASGTCPCDICKTQDFLEIHHIKGRNILNYNHYSNKTNICSSCHTKVHRGLIIIEGWFKTTNGLELLWHTKEEPSFSGQDSKPYIMQA